jgi:hypothetical protein
MIEKKLDESMKRDFEVGELTGYGKPLKRGYTSITTFRGLR